LPFAIGYYEIFLHVAAAVVDAVALLNMEIIFSLLNYFLKIAV